MSYCFIYYNMYEMCSTWRIRKKEHVHLMTIYDNICVEVFGPSISPVVIPTALELMHGGRD